MVTRVVFPARCGICNLWPPIIENSKDPTVWVLGARSEQDSASLVPEPFAFLLVMIAKPAAGQAGVASTSLTDHCPVGYTAGKGFPKTWLL